MDSIRENFILSQVLLPDRMEASPGPTENDSPNKDATLARFGKPSLGPLQTWSWASNVFITTWMRFFVSRLWESAWKGYWKEKNNRKQINDESAMACNVMLFFKYVTVISYGPYSSFLSLFPLQEVTKSIATHSEITLPLPPPPPVLPFHLFPEGSLVTICTKEYSEALLCNTNISSSLF